MDIHAPVVISAAGIYNTFETLLREKSAVHDKSPLKAKGVRHGYGSMSVYVGLKGTKEEFGLKAQNVWAFTGNELDKITRDFLNLGASDAGTEDIPILFISFPSTKDPEWDKRHPGKMNTFFLTFNRIEWFSLERWKAKSKVLTLANHSRDIHYNEPIRTRSKYMFWTCAAKRGKRRE